MQGITTACSVINAGKEFNITHWLGLNWEGVKKLELKTLIYNITMCYELGRISQMRV